MSNLAEAPERDGLHARKAILQVGSPGRLRFLHTATDGTVLPGTYADRIGAGYRSRSLRNQ